MIPLYKGDRIRTVIAWKSSFRNQRGRLVEMRGERPLVQLDGFAEPVLLFAHEVMLDESEPHMTAGD